MKVETLEREQREEQPALAARDEAHRAADLRGVLIEEADGVHLDVGVLADAVRVGVVARVLRAPPVAAHAHDAVADDQRQHVVGLARREDGAVRGLVREEGNLGEQDAEGGGDQELEPAVAEEDEAGDRPAEAERDRAGRR